MSSTTRMQLYRHPLSGHAHRVELALSLMRLPYEPIDIDFARRDHKSPAFLRLNPFGEIPVLVDDGVPIRDSNAILVYLATRYDRDGSWLPRDPLGQAEVQSWLSVAAGEIANGPAAARMVALFGARHDAKEVIGRSHVLLAVMDPLLATRSWLVRDQPTIADIACYSYLALAPEGRVDLEPYAHLRAWLARTEALPGFVGIQKTALPVAA